MNFISDKSSHSSRSLVETTFGDVWSQLPNDNDWFNESFPTPEPFVPGDVTLAPEFDMRMPGFELDSAEPLFQDSMMLDELPQKDEDKMPMVRELPEYYHESAIKTEPASSRTLLRFTDEDEDDSDSTSRARKRPRIELEMPDPATVKNVKHHFEELTALDSATFDHFVQRLAAARKITTLEQAELKKMKRRIHNRESARRSRQDKRSHAGALEEQVRALTDQLNEMKLEVATLSAANSQLQNEIEFSTQLIRASPILAQLFADLRAKHELARAGQQ